MNALETAVLLRGEAAAEPWGREIGLDEPARRVIELAVDEAARTKRNYLGTEHLLVGLMRLGDNPLADRLAASGVTIAGAREAVTAVLQRTEG